MSAGLIAELEQASEGNRELSDKVLLATGWRITSVGYYMGPMYHWSNGVESYPEEERPSPTESLDVAMNLVPEYHYVGIACLWPGKPNCRIEVYTVIEQEDVEVGRNENLTTPALALCIAALRAHEALDAPRP